MSARPSVVIRHVHAAGIPVVQVDCPTIDIGISSDHTGLSLLAFPNPHAITLPDGLASLSNLCLLQYPIDEETTVTKLPQPSANQKQILTALGVTLPAK